MLRTSGRLLCVAGVIAVGFSAEFAFAQSELDGGGRTALQNARGGAVRGRSPGNLVSAGVAQARTFGRGAAIGVEVSETAQPRIAPALLADSLDLLFERVVTGIQLFDNLLRLRGGLSPGSILSPSSSTDSAETNADLAEVDLADIDLSDLNLTDLLGQLGGQ